MNRLLKLTELGSTERGVYDLTEELSQYLAKTGKEPDFYTLSFPTHSVEVQNTFAEMFPMLETSPAAHPLFLACEI